MRRSLSLVFVGTLITIAALGVLAQISEHTSLLPTEAFAAEEAGHVSEAQAASLMHDSEHKGHSGGHTDPFAVVLLELALIVGVAMFGRWVAAKYKQASVLGELVIGVVVGNIGYWLGLPVFIMIMQLGAALPLFQEVWRSGHSVQEAAGSVFDPAQLQPGEVGNVLVDVLTGSAGPDLIAVAYAIWLFSNLGVILLLFKVGLESSIKEMLRVGVRSLMVAIVGIIVPFVLGFLGTMLLIPDAGLSVQLFLGATLTATSVGITARVFKDLRKLQEPSAKIVLGAAVIDDILGLIILAVVSGIVTSGMVDGAGGAGATSGLF